MQIQPLVANPYRGLPVIGTTLPMKLSPVAGLDRAGRGSNVVVIREEGARLSGPIPFLPRRGIAISVWVRSHRTRGRRGAQMESGGVSMLCRSKACLAVEPFLDVLKISFTYLVVESGSGS